MGKECFYVFDSYSKDENGNMSAVDTAVLLKFKYLSSLENNIISVSYTNYAMTLYFQI